MHKFRSVLRNDTLKKQFHLKCMNANASSSNNSSSSSSTSSSSNSDNDEKHKIDNKKKSQEVLNKLNILLKEMVEEDVVNSKSKLELAKPKTRRTKQWLKEPGTESRNVESAEKKMVNAVKEVAQLIGGDSKQTESELLLKLLSPTENKSKDVVNLSDIVKGMKIDRESKTVEESSRAQQVRQILQMIKPKDGNGLPIRNKQPRSRLAVKHEERIIEKIDLFGSQRLGIFNVDEQNQKNEGTVNKTWKLLHETELKLTVTHPPSNYFQEMILWTDQKKIWRFPIDNEQGMEEEQNICFTEHIFLEKHLDTWCPAKGPIRHFMELVCVGLSKNPYLTVDTKKETIDWYRKYFDEKKKVLQETGSLQGHDLSSSTISAKSIEG